MLISISTTLPGPPRRFAAMLRTVTLFEEDIWGEELVRAWLCGNATGIIESIAQTDHRLDLMARLLDALAVVDDILDARNTALDSPGDQRTTESESDLVTALERVRGNFFRTLLPSACRTKARLHHEITLGFGPISYRLERRGIRDANRPVPTLGRCGKQKSDSNQRSMTEGEIARELSYRVATYFGFDVRQEAETSWKTDSSNIYEPEFRLTFESPIDVPSLVRGTIELDQFGTDPALSYRFGASEPWHEIAEIFS